MSFCWGSYHNGDTRHSPVVVCVLVPQFLSFLNFSSVCTCVVWLRMQNLRALLWQNKIAVSMLRAQYSEVHTVQLGSCLLVFAKMAPKSASHPLYPPDFQHHQPSRSPTPTYSTKTYVLTPIMMTHAFLKSAIQPIGKNWEGKWNAPSSVHDEYTGKGEEDADCIELKETLCRYTSDPSAEKPRGEKQW